MAHFTKEQAQAARQADLSEFLMRTDPGHYVREGQSIRLIDPSLPKRDRRKSISIKMGTNWWHDFATGETGNCVEYLTKKMGYNLVDAILALSDGAVLQSTVKPSPHAAGAQRDDAPRELTFPEPVRGNPDRLFAYLAGRGIPPTVSGGLMKRELLYQSQEHNNLVFINRDRDFAEIRGTWDHGQPFHQVMKSRPDRFWSFSTGASPQKAFICESAIDAVSLYLVRLPESYIDSAVYISLAGVSNQQTIDRIRTMYPTAVLAVDNDRAGAACRERNPDLPFVLPRNKDWNEDLLCIRKERALARSGSQDTKQQDKVCETVR